MFVCLLVILFPVEPQFLSASNKQTPVLILLSQKLFLVRKVLDSRTFKESISCPASQWETCIFPAKIGPMRLLIFPPKTCQWEAVLCSTVSWLHVTPCALYVYIGRIFNWESVNYWSPFSQHLLISISCSAYNQLTSMWCTVITSCVKLTLKTNLGNYSVCLSSPAKQHLCILQRNIHFR